ncbi:MAG TPA: carbohydrate ABC transporter permease [Desulfomicrobiaceae bacterium]|nr:carbohydrate ABC transporter permease [Desulfomicrobiaceae bacterium]
MTRRQKAILTHTTLTLSVLIIAAPIIFAVIFSTQTPGQIFSYPPKFSFGTAMWENYSMVWNDYNLGRFMLNSFYIAIAVTVGKTVVAFCAALALIYFAFPLKSWVFVFILLTLMMPTETMIVALFEQVADFGWANSYAALIVPFLASATGTFLFRQHFLQIPTSLLDAARIDGAGPLRFAWHIVLPMSANVIAALAVIEFVYMWNQYLWPLIVIQESSYQVVQVGLRMMTAGQDATNWGIVMAGAIVSLVPALIVFMLLQEQFSRGFALSQEK